MWLTYSQYLGSSLSFFYGMRDPTLSPILSHYHHLPPPNLLKTRKQKQWKLFPHSKELSTWCLVTFHHFTISSFIIQHSPWRGGWKSSYKVKIHYLLFRRHFRCVLEFRVSLTPKIAFLEPIFKNQYCLIDPSVTMEILSLPSHTVANSHRCQLSTWNVASLTKEPNFLKSCFI